MPDSKPSDLHQDVDTGSCSVLHLLQFVLLKGSKFRLLGFVKMLVPFLILRFSNFQLTSSTLEATKTKSFGANSKRDLLGAALKTKINQCFLLHLL